jgi:hypothetical protein
MEQEAYSPEGSLRSSPGSTRDEQPAGRPRLGIAEGTIKRHLANVHLGIDVSSRGEAVRVALENEASMDEE